MKFSTPESAGISSYDVLAFYKALERYNLSTHSVIMARGDTVFTECYYEPFNRDFLHRMYSVSKSFVSVAVGFCVDEGLLSLSDPLSKYLSDYCENGNKKLSDTKIIDLLRMESSVEDGINWFFTGCTDRTSVYFDNKYDKNPSTLYNYDSSGSYILGVIVERVTGKPFLEYMKEKALLDIGFSEKAYALKCPGGHSFGDSGVMCRAIDLLLFARFVMNRGTWNGKRYLNEDYVKKAITPEVCTNDYGFSGHGGYGYGYQFWGMADGCFAMHGMGSQIALCDPKHDFIFVINSDNQGNTYHYEQIYTALYANIIGKLSDVTSLPEDKDAERELFEFVKTRKLFSLYGDKTSAFSEKINGKTFIPEENPMGIKWFKLDFSESKGVFSYENEQGEKSFAFGFGYNEFSKFPEEGYSDLTAGLAEPNNKYDAAFSADWPEERKLRIRVQIIDKYFGNLAIIFGFADENTVSVRMSKTAEGFLEEYVGIMNAQAEIKGE